MQLRTMIYTSVASTKVDSRSLREIADNSERRNSLVGVTGLLLYGSGNYFQLIEGTAYTVKSLYRRILTDNRHHDLRLLFDAPLEERVFPDWQMGVLNLDEPGLIPADFWTDSTDPFGPGRPKDADAREQALAWVRMFIEQQGRIAA